MGQVLGGQATKVGAAEERRLLLAVRANGGRKTFLLEELPASERRALDGLVRAGLLRPVGMTGKTATYGLAEG